MSVLIVSGERSLTSRLCPGVTSGLPLETVEWRRSYGRAPKAVNLRARWIPFEPFDVAPDVGRSLLDTPVLHTLWVEAADVDSYKAAAREEILNWLTTLRKCGVSHDWAVIVVEGVSASAASSSASSSSLLAPSGSPSSSSSATTTSSSSAESRKAALQMANKLLSRSSVIERVRSDVGAAAGNVSPQQEGKHAVDRCISLLGK